LRIEDIFGELRNAQNLIFCDISLRECRKQFLNNGKRLFEKVGEQEGIRSFSMIKDKQIKG